MPSIAPVVATSPRAAALALATVALLGGASPALAGPDTTRPEIIATLIRDGQAPFDADDARGHDAGPTNGRVRVDQFIDYRLDLNLNDPTATEPTPYANYTITTDPLPLGFVWNVVPAACVSGSITGDGKTTPSVLTCNMGTKTTGSNFAIFPKIRVLSNATDGSSVTMVAHATVDGIPPANAAESEPITTVVTSAPRADLVKGTPTWNMIEWEGVAGYDVMYPIEIRVPPGSEPLAQPLVLTDDISRVSPNARLYTGQPWALPGTATGNSCSPNYWFSPSASGSGRYECVESSPGSKTINVTINDIDFLAPSPTVGSPAGNLLKSVGVLHVFVPLTDIPTGQEGLRAENQLSALSGVGAYSGDPAWGGGTEPGVGLNNEETAGSAGTADNGTQNDVIHTLTRPSAYADKGDSLADTSSLTLVANSSGWASRTYPGTYWRSGDGYVARDSTYIGEVHYGFQRTDALAPGEARWCETIDNRYVTVASLGSANANQGAWMQAGSGSAAANAGFVIEYGIGGAGGTGATWASEDDQRSGRCDDSDSPVWATSINDPALGGADKITKIRARNTSNISITDQIAMGVAALSVNLRINATTPFGTRIVNFGSIKSPTIGWNDWQAPTYTGETASGTLGDRVFVTRTRVRVTKSSDVDQRLVGGTFRFTLQPDVTAWSPTSPITANDVEITDTLPADLAYVPGSATCPGAPCEPDEVINNLDLTTTLIWRIGDRIAGVPVPAISFDVLGSADAVNDVSITNTAVIASPDDTSPVGLRTAVKAVQMINPAAFSVQKSVATPVVEINDDIAYDLRWRNTSANAYVSSDMIEWLPFNGDDRNPVSNFTGLYELESITKTFPLTGGQALAFEYTKAVPSLPADADPSTINPAIVWCASYSAGGACPASKAEVRGIRIRGTAIAPGERTVVRLVLRPTQPNRGGDVYTNRFRGRVDGLLTPVESNNTPARVVDSSISDLVWLDLDKDGVQDAGEVGIAGIEVELYNEAGAWVATTTTDANGHYIFDRLHSGSYTVKFAKPAGYLPSPQTAASATTATDSDADPATGEVRIDLGVNVDRTDIDAGFYGDASVGDTIWLDTNGDGAQSATERGIPGVTVTLLNASGAVVATAVTDASGEYLFENLTPGDYTVKVDPATLPDAFTQTHDLNGVGTPDTSGTFALAVGEAKTDVDFGYRGTRTIGDFVWYDWNNDGVQDPTEPGIPGVDLQLVDGAGNVIATTATNASGHYSFEGVAPDTYTVRVVPATLPGGLAQTFDRDGSLNDDSGAFVLAAGTPFDLAYDFGYRGTGSLGDRVWLDLDVDGVQDPTESPLAGITVVLTDADGNILQTAVTDALGNYLFEHLPAGDFVVSIDRTSLPAGLAGTYDLDGAGTQLTTEVSLSGGQARRDVDFGLAGSGSLGDFIWLDQNGDGLQDPEEPVLAGVTVTLAGPNGLALTAVTGANGQYLFPGLPDGLYTVTVDPATLPAGVSQTYDLDGLATANVAQASISGGAANLTVDFGYRGTASVGDTVWLDQDADGVMDPAESGISGVTVTLQGPNGIVLTTTTDASGKYLFDNLPAGSYTVTTSTIPTGLAETYDLNGVGTANTSGSFALADGQARNDVDFGYRGTASVGDTVWLDQDADGVLDPAESGLAGVTVVLHGPNDITITATTDADGRYLFDRLPPGDYTVTVDPATLPAGISQTFDLNGVATANTSGSFALAAGDAKTDVDFGYRGTASVGDTVWLDQDGDGVLDPGETPLSGVSVTLNGPNGVTITATTDADGKYLFDHLPAGSYTVTVDPGSLPAGTAPTFDLNGVGTPNTSGAFALTDGQAKTDVDFGYRGTASVGDTVWLDQDADGVKDPDESGISGVTVTLTGPNGITLTATTDADGKYLFDQLPAGSYTVAVSDVPSGLTETYDLNGTGTPKTSGTFALADGQDRTDVDFGFRGAGSVGDTVWLDTDSDGVKDPDESGMSGVSVTLRGPNDIVITTTTRPDGTYVFDHLPPGDYTVTVDPESLPAGISPTFDLDGVGTANTSGTLSLADGQNRTDVDFGYRSTASVGDTVWLDQDGDGVKDPGESPLVGVTVSLTGPNGIALTATTDADGKYLFDELPVGDYVIAVDPSTLPAGILPTFDLNGTDTPNASGVLTLSAGENRTDVDFGYRGTASVGDTVWRDTDGDGVQDPGESGISGVTVALTGPNGITLTATTDADGKYLFDDLPAGDYTARVVPESLPRGLAQTFDLNGAGTPNSSGTFSLADGQNRTDVDFGYAPGAIGDRIWRDTDGDGVQDPGEPGIAGVTVILTRPDGTTVTTKTDQDGHYVFVNLPAGDYTVSVDPATLPPGLGTSFDRDGTGTPHTAKVTLDAGKSITDVDFGYRGGTIGDTVWEDTDGDGVQDPGERGIAGALVILTLPDGTSVTTRTGADGRYVFGDLPAGSYTARVDPTTIPAGMRPTLAPGPVTLSPGEDKTNVDLGFRARIDLTDVVYLDTNGNGRQDPGEPGIPGVTIIVRDPAGKIIATTTSKADGSYTFSVAPEDDYTVQIGSAKDRKPGGPLFGVAPTSITGQVSPDDATNVGNGFTPRTRLEITKSALRRNVTAGGFAVFTITVRNVGRASAFNVLVCDTLPGRLTLAGRRQAALRAGEVCWSTPYLRPGRSLVRRVVTRVGRNGPVGRPVTNKARAKASNAPAVADTVKVVVYGSDGGALPGVTG